MVVAVSDDTVLVVPVARAALTSSMPTMPSDDEGLRATVADAFFPPMPPPEPWRTWVTESEADCIATGVIDRLGADRVREIRFGLFPWSLLGYGLSLPIDVEDAEPIVETFVECTPSWELLAITSATQGTEYISESSTRCVADALDDTIAREVFVIELARPYDDPGADDPGNLDHLEEIVAAYEQCLTEQELRAIDWD
jgi:hypothetical protein